MDNSANFCPPKVSARRFRLGRRHSIGGNSRIQYVFRRGASFTGQHVTLIYFRGRSVKYCVSVSKKVGNAVNRNRVRRRITECFRLKAPELIAGQYVFVARESAKTADYASLNDSVHKVFHKGKLLRGEGK